MGAVEHSIRVSVAPGQRLSTASMKPAPFVIEAIESDALVLSLGPKRARTRVPWDLLDGLVQHLRGRGWVEVGSARVGVNPDSVEGYLRRGVYRSVASYVVAVLEVARVVEVDRRRPARARLTADR